MRAGNFLSMMWQQAEPWQLAAAIVCGIIVGVIYFESLHWSVMRLNESKHKIRMFVGVALFRIILFFAVLVLVSQRNVVIILLYVITFFLTKTVVIAVERNRAIAADDEEKKHD